MKKFLLILVLFSCPALAEVYKSVTADGEVVYTDKPVQGAERLSMPPLPTYAPPPLPTRSYVPAATPSQEKPQVYKSLEFVTPVNDETVRNNLGVLNIELKLSPPLLSRRGHRVQFFLNGEPYGPAQGRTSLTISNLDRGEYRLSAAVVDANGETVISAGEITVHMKRHSILQNAPKATPLPSGNS